MLKGLKKGDKKQTKKQVNKQKTAKNETKKPKEQQEEQANTDLVDVDYNEKQTTVKTLKKVQGSKLEEKQIDTSNIVMQKKQQKKVLTSWIVEQSKIKDLLRQDFNYDETEFQSLTDTNINKQLQEKAKKDAEENKPKIVEFGGIKMAPLQNLDKGKEQDYVFSKKPENAPIISNIPVKEVVFVNSNPTGSLSFAPLEKTAQQLKEEELETRVKNQPELAFKGKASTWLGAKSTEQKLQQAEFKVSAWAIKGQETSNQPAAKFAPLQKSSQEIRQEGTSGRREQQFKFSNKKEAEERRRLRELQEATLKKEP